VANFPSSTNPQVLDFPVALNTTVRSQAMSASCRQQYRLALLSDLRHLSRTVNYRICTGAMCPYVSGSGAPGSGVRVAGTNPSTTHDVFVAINTASLNDRAISFDVVDSTVSNNKTGRSQHSRQCHDPPTPAMFCRWLTAKNYTHGKTGGLCVARDARKIRCR